MSYWIIQAQENQAEPRVQMNRREWRSNTLAETLADRGHKVVRWRSAFSHQSKSFLADGNVEHPHDNYIQRYIDCPPYKRHVGLSRVKNHISLGRNFMKVARTLETPRLIHVGNVPTEMAYSAVRYGNDVGCPVVVDIRDLWPDIYVDILPEWTDNLRAPILKLLKFGSIRLKWTMRNASAITALTQPFMDWALELAGRAQNEDDAIFAMCYPRRDIDPPKVVVADLRARLGLSPDNQVATYLGNISRQTNFELIIEAAARLGDTFPQFKVVIAGSGPMEDKIRDLASRTSNVIVPGWLQGQEIAALLHISKIGLIAFHPVPNYQKNIPNKYSEYLAGGLAISCGLSGEMARLTRENDCGFTYPPCDVDALCGELSRVLSDPELLDGMRARARALHASKFDNAHVYPAFADHLERITNRVDMPRSV